jgi:hypothetical protein
MFAGSQKGDKPSLGCRRLGIHFDSYTQLSLLFIGLKRHLCGDRELALAGLSKERSEIDDKMVQQAEESNKNAVETVLFIAPTGLKKYIVLIPGDA